MSRSFSILLSLLTVFSAAPAMAQTAAPPSEALIDRFIASQPHPDESEEPSDPRPEELARLNGFNPGRSAEIRSILEAYQACLGPVVKVHAMLMAREAARRLGEAKLLRLIEFYEGSDFTEFAALAARIEKGEVLPALEQGRLDRLLGAYPLSEIQDVMIQLGREAGSDSVLMGKLTKCSLDKRAAFERSGLRYN